ncbi:acyl-CoA dehydrogenase [Micromonospora parva]|uniref:acyl-CoA dehydrogenase n=1 Tax=Micromonospora parva TaxID=1464048 RepID=UPI0033EC81C6
MSWDDKERNDLMYRRLRHVTEQAGFGEPLLERRPELFRLLEWSALADPSLFYGMFLHHCTSMGAILDLGRDRDDLSDLVTAMTSMSTVGSLMMTEIGRGNSNSAVRTEAVFDPDTGDFVLNTPDMGAVKFPPGVAADAVPRLAVVSAQLKIAGQSRGLFFFLVPIRDEAGPRPGVRITPQRPTPLLPLDAALVSFDRVRLPFRYWLRDGATIAADGTLHDPITDPLTRTRRLLGVIRFAWEAAIVGLAAVSQASAAVALQHAHRRITNGRFAADLPVIRYRNQQRALLGALADAVVSGAVAKASVPARPAVPTAGGIRSLSLMKVSVDRLTERVTMRCRVASGALGFFADNRFLDYQGLSHSFNTAAADNQIMLLDAALGLSANVDYTPPQAVVPPAVERDLTAPRTWQGLAATRERLLHAELCDRMGRAKEAGADPFHAWNDASGAAERLATAHAHTTVVGLLAAALDAVTDPQARTVLTRLCALHVLEETAAHDGWYLAQGLLTADEVRGLPDLVDQLCDHVLPHALDLVEALDVPYEVVAAPLAAEDYVEAIVQGKARYPQARPDGV